MIRRNFLKIVPIAGISGLINPTGITAAGISAIPDDSAAKGPDARKYWISVLTRIADPLLNSLSQSKLKLSMPYEGKVKNRIQLTYLEAFGRLLAGIAPWLELGPDATEEGKLRAKYIKLTQDSIKAATDPASPDYFTFGMGVTDQALVDCAFMAHGLLRGYTQIWEPLDPQVKANTLKALKLSRALRAYNNNWVLFSAMVEAFILKAENDCDVERIEFAFKKMEEWYKGDGAYGDGPSFHWDYYNSYVMHPLLIDTARIMKEKGKLTAEKYSLLLKRARRYAEVQERMISPEGTFPLTGRSLPYRYGAFQLLAQISLMGELPEGVKPAQVREALSAVIRRMTEAPGTFDKNGWLNIGFCGHQPDIAEFYISTGSLYLCSLGLLPLGLPADNEFWKAPPADWSSKKAWSGVDMPADHSISD